MSMISGQIDRLRTAAQTYRKMGNHSAENMFFEAADTILQLRDDLQRANADNAELREQMDGLASSLRNDWQIEASWDGLRRFWHVGWTEEHVESCAECAKGLGAYADSLCDPLKAENAKLRDGAAKMAQCYDEELKAVLAENAQLRKERNHWHVEQVHAYSNWEDTFKRAAELEAENAKLRELAAILCHCMQVHNDCDGCRLNGSKGELSYDPLLACDGLHELMRELGVEVDG